MNPLDFQNPDIRYRPSPFWAINDKIDPEEIARQISDMIDVGLSGAFFHSRAGLVTDYLGPEWFAAIRRALAAVRDRGGKVWLYDEDMWPSGNAGGQVAATKNEYRSATLNAILVPAGGALPELSIDQELKCCYAIVSRERCNLRQFHITGADEGREHERLLMVRTFAPKLNWWGGESYANLLHPDVARRFIEVTHEIYRKELGDEFGKGIPGIFTDEPQLALSSTGISWYEGLPELYAKWMGRDWWADLPYMFFDGPQARKIRLLVHRAINRQFIDAFTKPLYEWCEQNGIALTGHFNAEENLATQIMFHSGSILGHYRYQQLPGIDHIKRNIYEPQGWGSDTGLLFTCKQVTSAARQLGRRHVLTEIFGSSRHTNTFEDFKWLADFDLVLGADFFCPHLSWYSGRGRRKRDFPPNWNYQQTYWSDLRPLNDYLTRIGYVLTSGKAVCDILLLHCIDSATADHHLGVLSPGSLPPDAPTEDLSSAYHFDSLMHKTLEAILNAGYECDFGDEGYIEDLGNVEGDNFNIGRMSYKVVIVPPSTTWRPRTFDLLRSFASGGGKIVILGNLPTELDCECALTEWSALAAGSNVITLPCEAEAVQNVLDEIVPRTFTLRGMDGRAVPFTYVAHRAEENREIFFVVNSDRKKGSDYVLTFSNPRSRHVFEWDAVSGTRRCVEAQDVGSDLRYRFHLPPSGSVLLTLEDADDESPRKVGAAQLSQRGVISLGPELDFERSEENVLVLDRVSVSFDDGRTFEPEDLDCRVRRRIADRFGTSEALQWEPWVAIRKGIFDGKGGEIVLRYRFHSEIEMPKAFAVIEDLRKGRASINGHALDLSGLSWHWDRGFGKVEAGDFIKRGENILDFKVDYDFLTEVEAAYMVGDFGVALMDPYRGKIVSEPERLRAGSWSRQGYPFYTGRMVYKSEFKVGAARQVFLRLNRPSGILYKVRVNGRDAGSILWRPFELDLTDLVRPCANTIEIEVVSSLQNSWGPLHDRTGDDNVWTGPEAFEDESWIRDEINSFDYGLLGGAEIVCL